MDGGRKGSRKWNMVESTIGCVMSVPKNFGNVARFVCLKPGVVLTSMTR